MNCYELFRHRRESGRLPELASCIVAEEPRSDCRVATPQVSFKKILWPRPVPVAGFSTLVSYAPCAIGFSPRLPHWHRRAVFPLVAGPTAAVASQGCDTSGHFQCCFEPFTIR